MLRLCLVVIASFFATTGIAQQHNHAHGHYAGQQARDIKSLSPEDLDELRRGGGWGLAKAAELNGVPGPAHLLELKDDIPLTPHQISKITALFEGMKAEAIPAGKRQIQAERNLEHAFRSGGLDEQHLRALLDDISDARRDLRFIHLSRHLQTPPLLTDEQIARYNELRGYSASEPCGHGNNGHAKGGHKHGNCN